MKAAPAPVLEESVRGKRPECSTGDKGASLWIPEHVWDSGQTGDDP